MKRDIYVLNTTDENRDMCNPLYISMDEEKIALAIDESMKIYRHFNVDKHSYSPESPLYIELYLKLHPSEQDSGIIEEFKRKIDKDTLRKVNDYRAIEYRNCQDV